MQIKAVHSALLELGQLELIMQNCILGRSVSQIAAGGPSGTV